MKKILWILIGLTLVGYVAYTQIQSRIEKEERTAERKSHEDEIKSVVLDLVSKTNASDKWPEDLSRGERFRFSTVLSIELEKLWITQGPILFIGEISDIATFSESEYLVKIKRSYLSDFNHSFDTELHVYLKADKKLIDSLLTEHPNILSRPGFNNDVAVIASIEKIESKRILGESEVSQEIRIGHGELQRIMYLEGVHY